MPTPNYYQTSELKLCHKCLVTRSNYYVKKSRPISRGLRLLRVRYRSENATALFFAPKNPIIVRCRSRKLIASDWWSNRDRDKANHRKG